MRDHTVAVPGHHPVTASSRTGKRTVALAVAAALAVAGVIAGGVPASAEPGTGGSEIAYRHGMNGDLTDVAADPYTAQVFVARSNALDVFDENSGTLVHTVPFVGDTAPRIAADPTRGFVWVLDAAGNRLSRVDERTNTATGSVPIAGDLRDLAIDHTTGTVFVTTGSTGTVVPVDESTVTAGAALTLGGTQTLIGADASAGLLFSVDSSGTVSVIDESTFTVSGTVAGPPNAAAITVDAAHHKAYLGTPTLNTLAVIDGTALTASSIAVPSGWGTGVTALGIDPSTQTVIGRNDAQLFRVDTVTGSASTWNGEGALSSVPDLAVDVYTNTVFVGESNVLAAVWEPVSILGSASGVVAAGAPYSQQLQAYANPGPVTFSVTAGALPAGLTLTGDTISGTATTPGSSTFDITATLTNTGDSVTQTFGLHVVSVGRTAGGDRFATSVEVSKAAYPDPATVGTVYVANGVSFPDALSGGPAAAHQYGPLLLTAPGYLPQSVSDEITRLHPAHIVVVGGPNVVSADVLAALSKLSPDVQRVYGGDRFGTSRAVIQHTFGSAPTVYVATGLNFPDSLSAGGAAGSLHAPLLLVNGGASSVDSATASLLQSLHTSRIVVIGGSAVMSPALVADFGRFGTVTQLAGVDRFDTSQQIVESAFANSSRVILANGVNFPDALAASAWSGATSWPLSITPGGCVPQRTLDEIYLLGATDVTVVGGTAVLGSGVAALTGCGGMSVIAPTYPAMAPAAAKAGTSGPTKSATTGAGVLRYGHPVGASLPVSPRTHGSTGR